MCLQGFSKCLLGFNTNNVVVYFHFCSMACQLFSALFSYFLPFSFSHLFSLWNLVFTHVQIHVSVLYVCIQMLQLELKRVSPYVLISFLCIQQTLHCCFDSDNNLRKFHSNFIFFCPLSVFITCMLFFYSHLTAEIWVNFAVDGILVSMKYGNIFSLKGKKNNKVHLPMGENSFCLKISFLCYLLLHTAS